MYSSVVRERPSPESVVANDSLSPSVTGFSVHEKVPGEVSPKYLLTASMVSTKYILKRPTDSTSTFRRSLFLSEL